jgi:hypothetical protein
MAEPYVLVRFDATHEKEGAMTRSIRKTAPCVILIGMLAMSVPQAFAASDANAAGAAHQPVNSSAKPWTPPEGFVREVSFYGMAASCESVGSNGIAEGKWSAYLCVPVGPFSPFQYLYVKR